MRRLKTLSFIYILFAKIQRLLLLFSLSLLFANLAHASPNSITFQSRIVKPDGTALEAATVNFRFSITDTVGSCVIYQEDFSNRNMSGSKGLINLAIGSGTKVFPVAAMALTEVFNNYNSPTLNCQAGGNISAGTTDRRKLIVQFNDGSGWQTVPAMDINSNPYALQAVSSHRLGDFPAADYVRTATFPTCVGSEALHFNGASFACVAVGVGSGTVTSVTSANSDITVTNTTTTPQVTLNAGAGANQIVKLNGTSQLPVVSGVNLTALNATQLGSGTVPDARMPALTGDVTMTAGTTATSIANNAVTNTHVAAGAAITRTKLAAGSTNHVVVNDGITGALSSIGCSNGELIKWAGGVPTCSADLAGVGDIINGGNATGATVSVGTTDAQSFALKTNNAAAMTILSNGNVGVGTISPGAPLDVKGAIRMSGSTSGYTGFQPAATAGSTVWTLPVADGSNNQVLTTNGVGVLSWSTPSAGGITSLNSLSGATQTFANGATGTAPAFSSATTVHTLNIPLASGAGVTSGTISKTDYDAFTAKQAALGFTPLNPANNLSDVANAATSRTNLGLGTAAVLNVGTGNNNIVQLNGTAQLPAVDGSLLTGVVAASIANDTVTDVKVAAGAAIARTKLASGTNNHVLINDGSGVMSSEANLAVSRGGTGVGTFAANQIVGTNGTGSALTSFTCALNQIIKFDVTGNATCGTDLGSGGFVDSGNTFAATATIGTNSNHNLEIETNGTTKMTVLANGNVGIGTTAPNTTLDISGAESMRGMAAPAVSVAGQGRIYFDSTSNTYKVSQNNGAYTNLAPTGGALGGPGTINTIPRYTASTTLGNSAVGDDGTSVYITRARNAIGDIGVAPGNTLEVGGVTAVGITINSGAAAKWDFNSNYAVNNNLTLSPSVGGGNFIISGTNVGIGTTTPGAKLEVAGQVKITGGTPGAGKFLMSDAAGLATWSVVTDTLGGLSCGSGDSPYWNGSAWACRASSSSNSNSTLVLRDASGNFGANNGTFNMLKVDNGSGAQVSIITPAAFTSWQLRLPSDDGTANQVLQTNGSGDTSWATITATPGGSNGQIQFNGSSSFAGDSNMNWDNTNKRLGVGTAAPAAAIDTTGEVKVGNSGASCSTTNKGSIRYNDTTSVLEFCNGTAWNLVQAAACTDPTPSVISFSNEANATASTLYTSDIQQVTGINCSVPVTISGQGSPQYQVCSDASCTTVVQGWTSSPSSVTTGQYLRTRLTTDTVGGAMFQSTIIVGSGASVWSVTNAGGDCTGSPSIGTVCADGTIYAGLTPDGGVKMFTTRCDFGQTWDGSNCTGSRTSLQWNNGTSNWTTTGYTSTTTGKSNSAGIAALVDAGSPHAAAQNCENLNLNGKTDWYLPALGEVNVMYSSKAVIRNFDTSGTYYWSATEDSNVYAYVERFSDGSQTTSTKNGAYLVRCVRR